MILHGMITGVVTDRREAVIRLRVRGPAGQDFSSAACVMPLNHYETEQGYCPPVHRRGALTKATSTWRRSSYGTTWFEQVPFPACDAENIDLDNPESLAFAF